MLPEKAFLVRHSWLGPANDNAVAPAHSGPCPDPMACESCQGRLVIDGSAPDPKPRRKLPRPRLSQSALAVYAALGGTLPPRVDVEGLGYQLCLSPQTVRRALRDLAEARDRGRIP